jgi:hypothetical protein
MNEAEVETMGQSTSKTSHSQEFHFCNSLSDSVYWAQEKMMQLRDHIAILLAGAFILLCFSGCLTVESKEYRIKLKSDTSGEATIKFINIVSESDDTTDISTEDFDQLIEFYLEGNQLEKENPGYTNVRKRLYEENGILVGEITFDFDSLAVVRLFRYDEKSPFMYFVGNPLSAEQYVESNGLFGPDWLPVVFWHSGTRDLYFKTRIISEVTYRRSMTKLFHAWQSRLKKH